MEWYWIVLIVLGSYLLWCLLQTCIHFYINSENEDFNDKFWDIFTLMLVLGIFSVFLGGVYYLHLYEEKSRYLNKLVECRSREYKRDYESSKKESDERKEQ